MSDRLTRQLAGLLLLLALGLGLVSVGLFLLSLTGAAERAIAPPRDLELGLPFTAVGGLIALRRPRNLIGWSLLAGGLSLMIGVFLTSYARFGLISQPSAGLPGPAVAAALNEGSWAFLMQSVFFLVLLFPSGRLPSPRWRPVAWFAALGFPVVYLLVTLASPELTVSLPNHPNPLAIPALEVFIPLAYVVIVPLALAVAAAVVNLIVRFRWARGDEREQFKWLALAGGLLVLCLPLGFIFSFEEGVSSELIGLALMALPVAVGIAVLRYRLYDIDWLINRVLVYGLLTGSLVLLYWGGVALAQIVLRPVTQGSELAVIVSTLAVAALVQPARRRIQRAVDRRFYRQKYDAARTLAAFSAHLRDEVDLPTLTRELTRVVRETMQPDHVSLWIRPGVVTRLPERPPDDA